MLHACITIGKNPRDCVYIGDDIRDIHAGKAAGMRTVAAAYGYLGTSPPITTWEADAVIERPLDLLSFLDIH